MIKYNSLNINDWNLGDDNIIKVYRNNAVCYYKVQGGGGAQTPCFAVVDDITQYHETEFEDVYNNANNKWYKLNNLNEYEVYGVYGEGNRTIRLPQGYTEVEYIENDSTAYINTNLQVCSAETNTFVIHTRLLANRIQSDPYLYQNIFGALDESGEPYSGFLYRFFYNNIEARFNPSEDGSFSWTQNIDGTTSVLCQSLNGLTYTHTTPLTICCGLDANGDPFRFTNTRIYSFDVTLNGTLVADYVPCKRDSDSEYGLYDLVTNTFLLSPNNESFIGGNEIATLTAYEGKLSIYNGYEYMYSGDTWVNVGSTSGGTASLPSIPFTLNYNAKEYDVSTHTLPKTQGQLCNLDAVISNGYITAHTQDGYISVSGNQTSYGAMFNNYQTYFNRTSASPNLTIVAKAKASGTNCHLLANRYTSYNWMFRAYSDHITLHGNSETGSLAISSTQADIYSARVNGTSQVFYNNWTSGTSTSLQSFSYGSTNDRTASLFNGYGGYSSGEYFVGDFYWIYMSQNTLTDEEIQEVIDYNESSGQLIVPITYEEKDAPPNNIVFSSMAEAEAYECPWVGMTAIIDGSSYTFTSEYTWEPMAEKFYATYNDSTAYSLPCDGNSALTRTEVTSHTTSYSNMVSAEIGNCVTSIENNAFNNCTNLSSITIQNSVTSIGYNAFNYCIMLTSITIPSGVTSIGSSTFGWCIGLTSCEFGQGSLLTSIDYNAFQRCSGLTSINIPNRVTSIGNQAFSGCTSLSSVNIPSGVTSIGDNTFSDCYSLSSITIPSGVTSIGAYAFRVCSALTSCEFEQNSQLTSIGYSAFYWCPSLSSITIPNGITNIGGYAFNSCSNLTSITVEATSPPTLGSSVFDNTNNCPIYVPSGSVETYKAASGWSTYASRIQAIP